MEQRKEINFPNEIEKNHFLRLVEEDDRRNNLVRYSETCGPSVVGKVLGITNLEAAKLLCELKQPGGDWEYTNILTIGELLGKKVVSTARKEDGETHHVSFSDRFPSLGRWISLNKGRVAILRAGHHFALVAFGVILESREWEPRKGHVTHVIFLDD